MYSKKICTSSKNRTPSSRTQLCASARKDSAQGQAAASHRPLGLCYIQYLHVRNGWVWRLPGPPVKTAPPPQGEVRRPSKAEVLRYPSCSRTSLEIHRRMQR